MHRDRRRDHLIEPAVALFEEKQRKGILVFKMLEQGRVRALCSCCDVAHRCLAESALHKKTERRGEDSDFDRRIVLRDVTGRWHPYVAKLAYANLDRNAGRARPINPEVTECSG